MRESFRLTLRALVRGHVLTLLLASVALIHALFPAIVRGDSTPAGWREMFIRAVPGSVVAVVVVAVLACACGFFSRERETCRLAQTVIRPASAFSIAVGRWMALCAVAAAALGLNAVLTLVRFPDAPSCRHHLAPVLPPPVEVARQMMEEYLKEETDRYDAIKPGESQAWTFDTGGACSGLVVRACFSSAFSLRMSTRGKLALGDLSAIVSNNTQAVVEFPLVGVQSAASATNSLVFTNTGTAPVMLRPRRDIELLLPADPFVANLARATLQSFATIALLAAFGIFLSAALSRPVAVFTALVLLAVALMVPSAVEQFPDELEISFANRIGLWLSRGVSFATASFVAPSPVSDLASGRCIEWPALARTVLEDLVAWPTALLGLAAVLVRRHPLA